MNQQTPAAEAAAAFPQATQPSPPPAAPAPQAQAQQSPPPPASPAEMVAGASPEQTMAQLFGAGASDPMPIPQAPPQVAAPQGGQVMQPMAQQAQSPPPQPPAQSPAEMGAGPMPSPQQGMDQGGSGAGGSLAPGDIASTDPRGPAVHPDTLGQRVIPNRQLTPFEVEEMSRRETAAEGDAERVQRARQMRITGGVDVYGATQGGSGSPAPAFTIPVLPEIGNMGTPDQATRTLAKEILLAVLSAAPSNPEAAAAFAVTMANEFNARGQVRQAPAQPKPEPTPDSAQVNEPEPVSQQAAAGAEPATGEGQPSADGTDDPDALGWDLPQ